MCPDYVLDWSWWDVFKHSPHCVRISPIPSHTLYSVASNPRYANLSHWWKCRTRYWSIYTLQCNTSIYYVALFFLLFSWLTTFMLLFKMPGVSLAAYMTTNCTHSIITVTESKQRSKIPVTMVAVVAKCCYYNWKLGYQNDRETIIWSLRIQHKIETLSGDQI